MNLLGSKEESKKVSIHLDPFKKECVQEIDIHFTARWSSGPYWWATISFKNGNTSGSQKFGEYKIDEYEKMITEIQNFINSL